MRTILIFFTALLLVQLGEQRPFPNSAISPYDNTFYPYPRNDETLKYQESPYGDSDFLRSSYSSDRKRQGRYRSQRVELNPSDVNNSPYENNDYENYSNLDQMNQNRPMNKFTNTNPDFSLEQSPYQNSFYQYSHDDENRYAENPYGDNRFMLSSYPTDKDSLLYQGLSSQVPEKASAIKQSGSDTVTKIQINSLPEDIPTSADPLELAEIMNNEATTTTAEKISELKITITPGTETDNGLVISGDERQPLNIACTVSGVDAELKTSIYKDQVLIQDSDTDTVIARFDSLQNSDEGEYLCYGFLADKSDHATASVKLTVRPDSTIDPITETTSGPITETTTESTIAITAETTTETVNETVNEATTETTPEVKSGITPEIKPETTPEITPEITSEVTLGPTTDTMTNDSIDNTDKTETTTESVIALTPETIPETTSEIKSEIIPEIEPETTTETVNEVITETTPEITLEIEPEVSSEVTPEITSETISETIPEITSETISETIPVITSEIEPETTLETTLESTPEITAATKFETIPETTPETTTTPKPRKRLTEAEIQRRYEAYIAQQG